jgi:hypothetical protein
MESFTYIDIFATKGIEYILVISVLLLFIPFWRMLSQPAKKIYEEVEERMGATFNPQLGLTMADGGDTIHKEEKGQDTEEVTAAEEKHQ